MTYLTAPVALRPGRPTLAALRWRPAPTFARLAGRGVVLLLPLALPLGSPALAQNPTTFTQPAQTESATAVKQKPHRSKASKNSSEKKSSEAQQAAPSAEPKAAQQGQPSQSGQPPQQAQNGQQQQVQLIFSPWTKFCLKGQPGQPPDPNAKQVCFTGKDARVESGQPVAAAVLIEPEGQERKIMRVTLPLGMQLVHGTRMIIDQNQPMTAPYVICFTNGCMADYEANADFINKLKKGQGLVLQAINATGQPITLVMPLNDFAKAYDGPPTDPKVFEEQQRKLQEELQRRADEARKKLESQQGAPTSQATPPPGKAPASAQAGRIQ